MAIQVQGNGGVILEVDGTTYRAVRVSIRPADYGLLGQYRIAMHSGTMAAGLGGFSQIFQARWTSTPQLALIWGVNLAGMAGTATAFAAGTAYVGLILPRSWTVDGSGGSPAVLTGNNQMLRTSMGSTLMGSIRIATTAALGVGTSTIDTQGFGQIFIAVSTAASQNFLGQVGLYGSSSMEDGGNVAPIVLSQNEGIALVAAVPGTGTWGFSAAMSWSEVNSY
jgi:hypothetical protein